MNNYMMDRAWQDTLAMALLGHRCAPRGEPIRELWQHTITVDMNFPVLRIPERKLNYRFMAAEALWIITGRNDVEFLANHNPHVRKFSDDGIVFAGAYGPKIAKQFDYVVGKLLSDRDTRQATLTIWEPNPGSTRDYPCTVAMDFKIRNNRLNCHVFMRSSDIWLGLPYDVFSFTMVAAKIIQEYNDVASYSIDIPIAPITLGNLYLTAASSHLYERNIVDETLRATINTFCPPLPDIFLGNPNKILHDLMNSKRGDAIRWWEY